jgi:hypothetical protein
MELPCLWGSDERQPSMGSALQNAGRPL